MPSGVRRKAARKAGRDVTHNRREKKRAARKRTREEQVKQYVRRNPIIAEQWDHKDTVARNYERLGLARQLGSFTGGEEKKFHTYKELEEQEEQERLKNENRSDELEAGEARIVRDEEGNVVKIIYGEEEEIDSDDETRFNRDDDDDEDQPEGLKKLIALSKQEVVKKDRIQSEAEEDWISALVEKHGDDYEAMKWDKKLNIYQQSVGDLRKRAIKWKKAQEKKNKQ